MNDLRTILIGVISGFIVLAVAWLFKKYRVKSIESDIKLLEFEKKHLEKMKRSSVEMNRSSFREIFFLFALFGVANLIPLINTFIVNQPKVSFMQIAEMVVWSMFIGFCVRFWQRYNNLKNYGDALTRMDKKLEKLKHKLVKNS